MNVNQRILSILILCNGILGLCCGRHPLYPDQWPKTLPNPDNRCNNVSGIYKDKNNDKDSLTHLIVYSGKGLEYNERIVHLATQVVLIQTDKTIEVQVMNEKELLLEKSLILGKDVFCENGLHVRVSDFVCQEGVVGYGDDDYNLLPGEDGSLIIIHLSSGYGAYGCFPIIVPSDISYYRFEKYTP